MTSTDPTSVDAMITFPAEVQAAINEVLPSHDPLDQPDFSAVDYINAQFPTEQSLANLDDVITDMRYKVNCIDDDIRHIVRHQTHAGQDASVALEEAQTAILQLFSQIRDIKAKASESEAMVRDITRDIKQLDTAKRNLTTAIKTLNQLNMLVSGVGNLQRLARDRRYAEAASTLQGLMQVLEHFQNYTEIPQIKELSDQVHDNRRMLGEQITSDFEAAFSDENAKHFAPTHQMAEACLVVDVLDPKVKKNLLKWLVGREMAEYKIIFGEAEEASWLDRIESRYTWLKKHLIEFEERLGSMYPPSWEMSERITVEFCDMTRKQLEKIMFRRKHEMDTALLLHAIQKTANFESLLARRFTGVTLSQYEQRVKREKELAEKETNPFEENPAVVDPSNPFYEGDRDTKKEEKKKNDAENAPFAGIISSCFESYLSIYIDSQDKNLSDLVERAAADQRSKGTTNMAVEGSIVLHSCGDLFMFYKKCMMQCAQLSAGEPLLAMANVFKKHLREYATKVLISNLPKTNSSVSSGGGVSAGLTSSASIPNFPKDIKDIKEKLTTSALLQNFQNFPSLLREGDAVRLTDDEKVLLCTFLVTSEYCLETTQQLEAKLQEKIRPDLAQQINLGPEQDVYHSVINSCIQLLVQELDMSCEPSLVAMTKMTWSTIESVGDQSPYVTSLVNHMKQAVPLVRDNLANSRKYFTQFCMKFVNGFIPKFLTHVYRCKPISTVGAEQLLLDTHSIKTLLLDLPSVGSKMTSRKAPVSYSKIVVKGMTRAEMTLKVVMSIAEPMEQFVEQYIKLVPDVDVNEFQKVLDMKAIRKVDQAAFLEYFKTSAPQNLKSSSLLTSPSTTGNGEESRLKKLQNLMNKRAV